MPREKRLRTKYWKFKSIRDPLYGFVGFTNKEIDLISSSAFQRLGYLKQLSHAYQVYPSAVHTRFEHSLGTLHVADRVALNLGFDNTRRRKVRIAALLHDIGHGPFSHLIEDALKSEDMNGPDFSHELITRWVLTEDRDIRSSLGGLASDVLDILPPRTEECRDTLSADIISSGLDADKLDYLRRDSYHVGVAYGSFDLERILHTIDVTPDQKNLCVQEKGKDAIENYRLGRYLMHAQVYEHHARIIADQMFLRAIGLALDFGILDKRALRVGRSESSHRKFLDYYLTLSDSSIYEEILQRRGSKAARILSNIRDRKLLKRAYELDLGLDVHDALKRKELSTLTKERVSQLERLIARDAGIDPSDVIIHGRTIEIKLFQPYDILVLRRNGEVRSFDDMSPISASATPVQRLFVFCPKNKKQKVRHAARRHLGI